MDMRTRLGSAMFKAILLLAAGAILGAISGAWWMQRTIRDANDVVSLRRIASEGEAAMEQYLFAKPEIASYALERYIAFLEPYKESNLIIVNRKVISADLALALARLGVIEERLGKAARAAELYSKAREAFQETGRSIKSVDELKQTIERLDLKVRQTWERRRRVHEMREGG